MKSLILAAATLLIASTAQAEKRQIVEDKKVKNFEVCYLTLAFAVNPLYDKGLNPQKIIESMTDKTVLYKVQVENKTAFFTCSNNHFKVWIEDFSK